MVAEPTPGQKRERLAVLYALSVIAGAAFPRVAYLLLWPSRLGPRATLLYLAARFAEGMVVRAFLVPRLLRWGERMQAERAALTESLGREPTDDEWHDWLDGRA